MIRVSRGRLKQRVSRAALAKDVSLGYVRF
jgi:hypothetical protein